MGSEIAAKIFKFIKMVLILLNWTMGSEMVIGDEPEEQLAVLILLNWTMGSELMRF